MTSDRATVVILALVLAPWPVMLVTILLRGYDVHLLLKRRRRGDR